MREPGSVSFSWLEIQRTKASLIQQLDLQTNFTANETLMEFGLYPKDGDCEHKCPELDACIASNLWCDGKCAIFINWIHFCLLIYLLYISIKATKIVHRDTMSRRANVVQQESY